MGDVSWFNEMSDDAFYKLLKSKEHDQSWTIRELIEYEKRGSRPFDHDLKLVAAIDHLLAQQQQKFAEILKPLQDSMSKMVSMTVSDSTKRLFESLQNENAKFASLFPKIEVPKFDFPTLDLADLARIEPAIIDRPYASAKSQEALVESIREVFDPQTSHLARIANNTMWDWKQWTLFGLAAVAALTGIAALFI